MLTSEDLAERTGYLAVEEVVALKELTLSLRPNPKAVNIGSGMGVSGLALMKSRPDLYLYSIDIEADSTLGSLLRERKALEEAGMWDPARIEQIRGDSREIGSKWNRGTVDIVFVDDGHFYPECKGDIETWLPHIRDGGMMVFHDYGGRYGKGVVEAVDELMASYERIAQVDTLIAFRIGKADHELDE